MDGDRLIHIESLILVDIELRKNEISTQVIVFIRTYIYILLRMHNRIPSYIYNLIFKCVTSIIINYFIYLEQYILSIITLHIVEKYLIKFIASLL